MILIIEITDLRVMPDADTKVDRFRGNPWCRQEMD